MPQKANSNHERSNTFFSLTASNLIKSATAVLIFTGLPAALATTTYRCETGSSISYADKPCRDGKQQALNIDPANPSDADRAAAIERAKAAKTRLHEIEAAYEKERKQLAAEQKRARQEKQAQQRQCAKLELKIKREREDLRSATGRNVEKQRTQLKRAEEDHALECGH